MDDDDLRRGKVSTHKKFGESTAVLAGNSLLTMSFEILTDNKLKLSYEKKNLLINFISKSSGHTGIAGGQFSDLNFENKKISQKKITDMEIKKTGKLFSFCCMVPAIIKNKNIDTIKFFEKIGSEIGLLFQIADDLIDYRGDTKRVGKKTKKDQKRGKANLISLLGYNNTVIYADKLKLKIQKKLKIYGKKSNNLSETLEYFLFRNK